MSFKYVDFPNLGILEVSLTEEDLAPIKQEIKEIQSNFDLAVEHNSKLVGNLSQEYRLFKSHGAITKILFKYLKEYDKICQYTEDINVLTQDLPMVVNDPWVNFQKKHEFNPPHKHTGIVSFVIWIQIPYDIKDEMAVINSKNSASPLAGHFSFHYNNILGETWHHHIPADKSYENKMLIFPASLNHSVSPFYTSDDYRISVSGNVRFLVR